MPETAPKACPRCGPGVRLQRRDRRALKLSDKQAGAALWCAICGHTENDAPLRPEDARG
jgi:hypothetical protein